MSDGLYVTGKVGGGGDVGVAAFAGTAQRELACSVHHEVAVLLQQLQQLFAVLRRGGVEICSADQPARVQRLDG